jgi:hypothetical protein
MSGKEGGKKRASREEEEPEEETLEVVNNRLANIPVSDCRIEDILMEW